MARALSSAGERSLHTGEVVGSIPTAPTSIYRANQHFSHGFRRGPSQRAVERRKNMQRHFVENPESLFPRCSIASRGKNLPQGLLLRAGRATDDIRAWG